MTGVPTIPLALPEVSDEFLTHAFRAAGLLKLGSVEGFRADVIGTDIGFLGDVAELTLRLRDADGPAPESMILKIPAGNDNRQVGQTLGVYEREIRFYQELAADLNITVPRHWFSAMEKASDPVATLRMLRVLDRCPLWLIRGLLRLSNWVNKRSDLRYVLMIEHLGHLRFGDQVAGCSLEDAERAVTTLARLHAQFWDSEALDQYSWLVPIELTARPAHAMYLDTVDAFRTHSADWLTEAHHPVLDWLEAHYFDLMHELSAAPATLMHGDYRLDNLCFDDAAPDVVVLDWQTLGRGTGAVDLAYFISGSIQDPALVDRLIRSYCDALAAEGVQVDLREMRRLYQLGLLAVFHRTIPANFQDMLELGDGRGMDIITSWHKRILGQLADVDTSALLRSA